MARIHRPEIFIIKQFFPRAELLRMREEVFACGLKTDPSWHPLYDGCPDYHRIHNDYEKAYVKGKIHAFYRHGWYPKNASLFTYFREIFQMKCHLAGDTGTGRVTQVPSEGLIARITYHHYPCGGGYQAEHIDPHGTHARIQTLITASQFGADYGAGGLHARKIAGGEACFIDSYTALGDLVVMSPAIPHGVAPIDPHKTLDWTSSCGRWTIIPLFVRSDYPHADNEKPKEVNTDGGSINAEVEEAGKDL